MRKSFLRIFSLILACIFVVSLVGCHSSSDGDGAFSESSLDSDIYNDESSEGLESDGMTELESSDNGNGNSENDDLNNEENADKNDEKPDGATTPEGGTTTPEGGTTTPEGGTTTPDSGTTTPVTPPKPNYVNINWKSLYNAGLMRSQWWNDIGKAQNNYTSLFTVTATDTALNSAPKGEADNRSYFSTRMYNITSTTSYEYTFEAKNDRAGGYVGVVFAYDVNGKLPYFAYGEFDNRSDKGSCIHIRYRKGHSEAESYACAVNTNEVTAVVKQTTDGYGQYKVIYEGFNVKFCYLNASGAYVQLGSTITLPAGSKVCVGVYSRAGATAANERRTVSLRNCVLTAKNDATVDCLAGQNISLVKTFNVKIATFNICKAEFGATKYKDYTKIVAAIKASGADIIGLQEVDYKTKRTGYVDQTAKIAQLAGYSHYKFFRAFDFNEGGFGVAVLSKYPISNSDQINLPSGTGEQRILARAGIRVNNELINFFVTHLSYNGEPGTNRAQQFTTLANKIANYSNVIVTGDFNTDHWPQFDPVVNKGFLLVNKSDSDKTGTHYVDGYGYLAIDNIVHSKIFTSSGRAVVNNGASDHHLLYATLTYKE